MLSGYAQRNVHDLREAGPEGEGGALVKVEATTNAGGARRYKGCAVHYQNEPKRAHKLALSALKTIARRFTQYISRGRASSVHPPMRFDGHYEE